MEGTVQDEVLGEKGLSSSNTYRKEKRMKKSIDVEMVRGALRECMGVGHPANSHSVGRMVYSIQVQQGCNQHSEKCDMESTGGGR